MLTNRVIVWTNWVKLAVSPTSHFEPRNVQAPNPNRIGLRRGRPLEGDLSKETSTILGSAKESSTILLLDVHTARRRRAIILDARSSIDDLRKHGSDALKQSRVSSYCSCIIFECSYCSFECSHWLKMVN